MNNIVQANQTDGTGTEALAGGSADSLPVGPNVIGGTVLQISAQLTTDNGR